MFDEFVLCACSTHCQSIEELEKEMLNGQKLQGPATSAEVYHILKQKSLVDKSVFNSLCLCLSACLFWFWCCVCTVAAAMFTRV